MTEYIPVKNIVCYLLFCVTINIFFPMACNADIDVFVKKYSELKVDADSLRRIKKYEHLIIYFTGFAYFEANRVVSPEFLKALIIAESSANPTAHSTKGALGLGQHMYPTAKKAALSLAQTRVDFRYVDERQLLNLQPEDLYDPAINIMLSCYLVAKYNYRFNGRIDLVMTAWNAGENTDSLKTHTPASYQETEKLIGKVNGYYLYFLTIK